MFFNAQELEVGSEYRGGGGGGGGGEEEEEEEEVIKGIPELPILETSEQCKRDDDEDAKYIVSKTDLSYSLSDEEYTEKVINVMPSSGTVRKSNGIKKILHPLNRVIFIVSLDQNDINNSKENLAHFTTNPKHNETNFSKNSTKITI